METLISVVKIYSYFMPLMVLWIFELEISLLKAKYTHQSENDERIVLPDDCTFYSCIVIPHHKSRVVRTLQSSADGEGANLFVVNVKCLISYFHTSVNLRGVKQINNAPNIASCL